MNIFLEIYQILFISSIIFIGYFFTDLAMKMIVRLKTDNPKIKYSSTWKQKVLLWISLAIFISFLI